jgi:hypothetical protein
MSLNDPGSLTVNASTKTISVPRKSGKSAYLTPAEFYRYLKSQWGSHMTTRVTIDGVEVPDVEEVRLDQSNDWIDVTVHGDPNKAYLTNRRPWATSRLLDVRTTGGKYVLKPEMRNFDYARIRNAYEMDPVMNKVLDRMQALERALAMSDEVYKRDMTGRDDLQSKIHKQGNRIKELNAKVDRMRKKLSSMEAQLPKDDRQKT